jgi:hypothetical protein
VFDGQRLAMQADEPSDSIKSTDASAKPALHKRSFAKRPATPEPPKKPETSAFSSLFGKR